MKPINTFTSVIGVVFLILFSWSSHLYAEQVGGIAPSPGSNESTEVDCSVYSSSKPATLETMASVVETARLSLDFFLVQVKPGKEGDFGFSDRTEIESAVIADKPYQLYARCQGSDYPTDIWRVPVTVSGEMKGFIGVEWVNSTWKAVDFGGKKLAEAIENLENNSSKAAQSLSPGTVHRIIIRDFQNRTDHLLLKTTADIQIESMTTLNFPEVIQEQNEWCWAGVSASLFDYFDSHVEQCEIAEYTRQVAIWHDFGATNCCIDPSGDCNYWNYNWGNDGSIEDILENMQNKVEIWNDGVGRAMTTSEVEVDLENDLPPIIRWGWDSGGGHFVVAFGLDENGSDPTDPYMHYMDPWFTEGNKIALFSWVIRGGTHTWSHTNRLTAVERLGDTDGSKHLELTDVMVALKVVSNIHTTTPNLSADVNSDTKIGIAEAIYTLNEIAGTSEENLCGDSFDECYSGTYTWDCGYGLTGESPLAINIVNGTNGSISGEITYLNSTTTFSGWKCTGVSFNSPFLPWCDGEYSNQGNFLIFSVNATDTHVANDFWGEYIDGTISGRAINGDSNQGCSHDTHYAGEFIVQ